MGIQINGNTDIISATDGSLSVQGNLGNLTGDLTGNVTGDLTGNVNSPGISTVGQLNVGIGGTVITTTSDKVGIGITNPTSKLHVVGDVYSSGTVTGSGNVIQVYQGSDVGSTSNSTSITNANAAFINFTPKRNDSIIYIHATFQAVQQNLAGVNAVGYHTIAESNTDLTAEYTNRAFSGSGGLGCGTMSGIQTSIASTGTSSRQFHIRHRTSDSPAFVGTFNIMMTFMEVAP